MVEIPTSVSRDTSQRPSSSLVSKLSHTIVGFVGFKSRVRDVRSTQDSSMLNLKI